MRFHGSQDIIVISSYYRNPKADEGAERMVRFDFCHGTTNDRHAFNPVFLYEFRSRLLGRFSCSVFQSIQTKSTEEFWHPGDKSGHSIPAGRRFDWFTGDTIEKV